MGRRFNWSAAIVSGAIAVTCVVLCFVWPTPWVYTQDRAQRVNRFTQIREWRYLDGTYKPPQDISGYPPVAQFSLSFLWQSLQEVALPNDTIKHFVPPPVSKVAVVPHALTRKDKRMLAKFRWVRCGMSEQKVRHLLGEPAVTWGVALPDFGGVLRHWDYPVGEIDFDDDDHVVSTNPILTQGQ
jgi:hypothetical protein